MTRKAQLEAEINSYLTGAQHPNPRRPPMFTSRAHGRKAKSKNPIHISTQDKGRLRYALRNPRLGERERSVLRKLSRSINVKLTDSEMGDLKRAASCPALTDEQRYSLDMLVAHQYNNGRAP